MIPREITQPPTKEAYLAKFKDADRNNLIETVLKIKESMRESGTKGSLIAVGGTINKPGERKDIDVVMVLNLKDKLNYGEPNISKLERANLRYEEYKKIIGNSSLDSSEIEEIPPAIDEEFRNDSILKSEGIFSIKRNCCKPVEIICYPNDDYQYDDRDAILLERVD